MSKEVEKDPKQEGGVLMREQVVMLKIAELLCQKQLISPDEKAQLRKLINGGNSV